MEGRIRPESLKVVTRRRTESRGTRNAIQRETEWKFLIHQLLAAPVRHRSFPAQNPASPDPARHSSPKLRQIQLPQVMISIIFFDRAFVLQASGSGRIPSALPSMVMAGQNRKVTTCDELLISRSYISCPRNNTGLFYSLLYRTLRFVATVCVWCNIFSG